MNLYETTYAAALREIEQMEKVERLQQNLQALTQQAKEVSAQLALAKGEKEKAMLAENVARIVERQAFTQHEEAKAVTTRAALAKASDDCTAAMATANELFKRVHQLRKQEGEVTEAMMSACQQLRDAQKYM
jgi:uncharacterized protein (UPF0335 family)